MKVLFSLGVADIRETLTGIKSIIRVLGLVEGVKTINHASIKHFAAIMKGEGSQYPEKGKRRVWFKLHYLKHVYEYLKKRDDATADQKVEKIIKASTLQFIGQMIPASYLFTKEFMLNAVWQNMVEKDYNIEGSVMPPEGNSISVNVRRCFYDELSREVGLMPIADKMCNGDFIFWETYHPNVRFSRTKTLIGGDDHCNHTITWVE
ncbi:MAG: L-2-amino-thiazoline-4-carboxylic acid hydrolase [Desulfobacterales bacterium]